MAKKAKVTVEAEMAAEKLKKAPVESKKKEPEITIEKYFQLEDPPVHIYTRSYVGVQFRGIIKTRDAWSEEMKQYFEEKE